MPPVLSSPDVYKSGPCYEKDTVTGERKLKAECQDCNCENHEKCDAIIQRMSSFDPEKKPLGEDRLAVMIKLGTKKATDTKTGEEVQDLGRESQGSNLYERRLPVKEATFSYGAHFPVPSLLLPKNPINCNTFYDLWEKKPSDMRKLFSETEDQKVSSSGEQKSQGGSSIRRSGGQSSGDEFRSTRDLLALEPAQEGDGLRRSSGQSSDDVFSSTDNLRALDSQNGDGSKTKAELPRLPLATSHLTRSPVPFQQRRRGSDGSSRHFRFKTAE